MYYDAILSHLGEFGPYQKRKIFYTSFLYISIGIHVYSIIFHMVEPPFRCAVPGLENDTYHIQDNGHQSIIDAFIPKDSDTGQYSQCSAYFSSDWNKSGTEFSGVNPNETVQCERWVYDSDYSSSSAVSDWDLVCQNVSYRDHVKLMVMLGLLVGSLCGGTLADYFGRKKTIVASLVLQFIAGMTMAFVSSPLQYMALRFTLSALNIVLYITAFVLVAEIVGPKGRTVSMFLIKYAYCIGVSLLILIYYCIKDWRIAQIGTSAPLFGCISCYWLLDESPRWLIVKGRDKEAKAIMETIAKTNGTKIPDDLELKSSLEVQEEDTVKEEKIWHICVSRVLVLRIVILALGWCTSTMVYYGLTLNVNTLIEGNIYVTMTVQLAFEFLSHILCMVLLGRIGRRTIYCASILLSGFSCFAMTGPVFTKMDIKWISIVLFGLGKFGITGAFDMVYIVTTELLPTSVRNSSLGFCSSVGRIAGMISPYITSVGHFVSSDYGRAFPLIFFGIFAVVSGLLALLLPESRNKKLPETIKEAGMFGRTKVRYEEEQDCRHREVSV